MTLSDATYQSIMYQLQLEKIRERISYYLSLQKALSSKNRSENITYKDIHRNLLAED